MLRHIPSLEQLQREMRERVCAHCHLRPPHSEMLGCEAVRPCEIDCPLFVHLPLLRKTALSIDPMLGSRRKALQDRIDQIFQTSHSHGAGDAQHKANYEQRMCAVRENRDRIVDALLEIVGDN